MFKHTFRSQYQWFDRLTKQIKKDKSRDQQEKGLDVLLADQLTDIGNEMCV